MNARHYYHYSLMLLVLSAVFCPAAGVRAQYIKKEKLPIKGGEQEFAVFYADGMPETAQWPLGTVIVDDVGRTTRHQVTRGNGRNRNINSKVSARFIISPFDVPISGDLLWSGGSCQGQWNYAVGDQEYYSTLLEEQFRDVVVKTGCFWFGGHKENSSGRYTNRKWRLPTQRELMIMMVLQDGINAIYGIETDSVSIPDNGQKLPEPTETTGMNGKIYWSATEEPDGKSTTNSQKAWVVDFTRGKPAVYPTEKLDTEKTVKYRLRCVSDY
mgnify:FL=1